MFTIEFTLDLGFKNKHSVVVLGSVTEAFGHLRATVTSVQADLPTVNRKRATVELKGLLCAADIVSMEEALAERYTAIRDKYQGQPDDYPRDEETA